MEADKPLIPAPPSLAIPEIYDFHAKHNGHRPFVRLAHDNGGIQEISFAALDAAVQRAARFALSAVRDRQTSLVGILAISDSITFLTTLLGFFRSGVKVFCISPRNSPAAVADLFRQAKSVECLVVSSDDGTQRLAAAGIAQSEQSISLEQMPTYEQLYLGSEFQEIDVPLDSYDLESVALILHSSGSTNHPKAIPFTHRSMAEWGYHILGDRDLRGEVLAVHGLNFFHGLGILASVWCLAAGMQLALFPPARPPIRPTPENIFSGIVASRATYICAVPSHIERWAAMPETHDHLAKQIKAIIFSGAPLDAGAADLLTSKGVDIQPFLGATELGGVSVILPKYSSARQGNAGIRFQVASHCNFRAIDRSADNDGATEQLVELLFLEGPHHHPNVFNTTFEGQPACTTGDLFVRVPGDGENLFRFYGRDDDTILLSTGEKTNPVPIEKILLRDENVEHAVLFGQGRLQNGVLIQPSLSYTSPDNVSSDAKLAHFRKLIAPSLRLANEFAPSHSFILPELVLIAETPFELTGKNTVRRRHTLNAFAKQIEHAYRELERSEQPGLQGPAADDWSLNKISDFITAVVHEVVGHQVAPDVDLFDAGADSLQATWIRNTVLRSMRDAGFTTRKIPAEVVFQFPTIRLLAAFLFGYSLTNHESSPSTTTERELKQTENVVWPELGRVGETIVKLRDGENPLIIIHGAGGTLHAFPPLQEKFTTGLWAIQVTPDTPFDSMEGLVSFYLKAIKREQPQGPYRISGFSGGSIIALAIAKRLEEEGFVVVQVALVDHNPSLYFCPVYDLKKGILESPSDLHKFYSVSCQNICDVLRRDGGGRIAKRHQLAQELSDVFAGKPAPEFSTTYWRTVERFLRITLEYMLREDFPGVEASSTSSAGSAYLSWQRTLKAPVSVYIASQGIRTTIPEAYQAAWGDLGTHSSWPHARIYDIPGGHFDILGNDRLVDLLQTEWK